MFKTGGAQNVAMGALEDDDEEDPEWQDFDPKKETGSFFGRVIEDESAIREQVKIDKEKNTKRV